MLKAVISSLGTGLYAVYKGESNALASLTTNLYAVYKAESNANDSLATYNGTAQGGLTYTAGKSGNAFTFNGTTSRVDLPNNSLNFSGDFSFSVWFKPYVLGGNQALVGTDTYDGTYSYGFLLRAFNSSLQFNIFGGASGDVNLPFNGNVFNDNWYNIIIEREASVGTKAYVNGVLNTSNTSTLNPSYQATQYANMGAIKYNSTSVTYYLNGALDEVYFWNRLLTATEKTELYNSGNGKFYQGNAFYSTIVNDSLGTYDGTAQGGLTYSGGKSGNAFTFNGTNAYVSLPDNSLKFTGNFSVSLWFYCKTSPALQTLINGYDYTGSLSGGWILSIKGASNYLEFQTYINTQAPSKSIYQIPFNTSANNNQWVHISLTRVSSTSTKIYINGTEASGSFVKGSVADNPTYLTNCYSEIGGDFVTSGGLINPCVNGTKIDEVNVWTKELTATEITELYNTGTGKFYPY